MTTAESPASDIQFEKLSRDECRDLLAAAAVGRIAFVVDGLPVVLPVNYRLVSDDCGMWILLRTRPGNVIDRAPSQVAFEIDGVDLDHHQGWSVLVRGDLHRLDRNEIELMTKRFDPKPWPQHDRTSWLAVKTRTVSGRRLLSIDREFAFPSEAYL